MTQRKHLKQLVRARMQKTGERYSAARRQIVAETPPSPEFPWHFPGRVPATTALRVLLAHSGVRAPHTGKPFTEAMLFGIAGGIGIGVCSFAYQQEDFASFFIAGRHLWIDDAVYTKECLRRFGITPVIRESSGGKSADKQLRDLLHEHGVCMAWVDMAHLPHRALPQYCSGGGYHVVTVYEVNDADGTAFIGDLTDKPIEIPLTDLAVARGRIKKFKNRVLALKPTGRTPEFSSLVRSGLEACYAGLAKQKYKWFTLAAVSQWADRLHGSKDKDSWERVFAPGKRLWRGLVSVYDCIEHYGTGGGLCRPTFADFLTEAGDTLQDARLHALSQRYRDLGTAWSDLARSALPDDVPALRAARELHQRKAQMVRASAAREKIRAVWNQIDDLERQARDKFPLSASASAALRADLQKRVRTLCDGEVDALEALRTAITSK